VIFSSFLYYFVFVYTYLYLNKLVCVDIVCLLSKKTLYLECCKLTCKNIVNNNNNRHILWSLFSPVGAGFIAEITVLFLSTLSL